MTSVETPWEQAVHAEPSPLCIFDFDYRLIAFNRAHSDGFFDIYGYRVKVGDVFPDLFLPEQAPIIRGFMARALAGETFEVVEEFGDPDLNKPYWAIFYAPLRDRDGRIVGAFHRAQDISARLRAEVAVTEARRKEAAEEVALRRLTKVLHEIDDALRALQDPEEIAAVAARMLGEAIEASAAGFGTMREDETTLEIADDWRSDGVASVAGFHHMPAFGSYLPALQRGEDVILTDVRSDPRTATAAESWESVRIGSAVNVPVMEGGRCVAVMFVHFEQAREWTRTEVDFVRSVAKGARLNIERRRAEARLRAFASGLEREIEIRTNELSHVWSLSKDPLLIASRDGRWLRVSPAWHQLLEWSDSELLGRTSTWIEHPDDQARTRAEVVGLARGASSARFENRLRSRSGAYLWFSWSVVAFDGNLYCVARDVTGEKRATAERERLEDALRQSQKMEAVGQLTGGLAHDFNNLLTGVSGSLEMIQRRTAQGKFEDIGRHVGTAQAAARRAAALTHRLLAFSRRQTLDPKPTDVRRLIDDMIDMVRRSVGPHIRIDVQDAGDLWPTRVDPNQLENAVLNLCLNARDAMPDGGTITIEAANRAFDEDTAATDPLRAGEYVVLSVTDIGTGMKPEVVKRAFEPFFTTKPLGAGTGLGLSMIYGFVQQSGGEVVIDSVIGRGTTVRVYLPRDHKDPAPAPVTSVASLDAPRATGEAVLVIDDEPSVRMLVGEIVDEMGYRVIEAADGAIGLKALESPARIDLLITDVGLPGGLNGRQVADAARRLRPTLPVLFITGFAEQAVLGEGSLDAGMAVLTKPFTLDALSTRVRSLLATS